MKVARHKRSRVMCFGLYEMARTGKFIEAESQEWLAAAGASGKRGVTV